MANLEKTVAIVFQGKDDLSKTIRQITGKLDKFGSGIDSMAKPLAAVGDSIIAVDTALTALAAGAMVAGFQKSKDMESALADLQKVMGDGESVTDSLRGKFTELSRAYGEGEIAIVDALAGLRQSGFDTAAGLGVLETSLKVARATELDAEESTTFLKRALIGYNLEAGKAVDIGNLWNHTSNVSNTTVRELAAGFTVVARQAMDSGFSMEELTASLVPIIAVFGEGTEAGNAMSVTLSRLADPSGEAETALKELLGVSGDLKTTYATNKDLFVAVADALQDVDAQTKATYLSQIVGKEQAKRLALTFDDYADTLKKVGGEQDRFNSLQKEFEIQNATAQASVDKFVAAFKGLGISIGNEYRKAAQSAIDGATSIEQALADAIKDDSFKPVFDAVRGFATEIGAFLQAVAVAMPEAFEQIKFDDFTRALNSVGSEIGEFFGGLDLTKPEDLAEAVQFAVDSIESLITVTAGMIESMRPVFQQIVAFAGEFNDLDRQSKMAAGNVLGYAEVISKASGVISGSIDVIAGALGILSATSVVKMVGGITAIKGAFAGLSATLLATPAAAVTAAGALGVATGSMVRSFVPGVDEATQKLFRFVDILFDFSGHGGQVAVTAKEVADSLKAAPEAAMLAARLMQKHSAEASESAKQDVQEYIDSWRKVPQVVETIATAKVDKEAVKQVREYMVAAAGGGAIYEPVLKPKLDEKAKATFKEEMTELEKRLAHEIDMARISADKLQSAMEFQAKIDITQIETSGKTLQALSGSWSGMFANTGSTMASFLDRYDSSKLGSSEIFQLIQNEERNRRETLEMQKALTESEIALNEARSEQIRDGGKAITINVDGSGLQPETEAWMWAFINAIQDRITATNAEFLLGIGS